jgi:4-carboxymuconolactone decarboxylase
MRGPFNVWLYSPTVGKRLVALGGSLREDTALDSGLNELAICTVSAYWRSSVPFAGHTVLTRKFGIGQEILDALVAQERPVFPNEQQEVVYDLASAVVRSSALDDHLYERAAHYLWRSTAR